MQILKFQTEEDQHNWCDLAAKDFSWVLKKLFPPETNSKSAFQLVLNLPNREQTKHVFERNKNLMGSLKIIWCKIPDKPLLLNLPLPYCDVFLLRNRNRKSPLSYMWCSYLGEAPGFRYIRTYSKAKNGEIWWRLGLMHGNYLEGSCEEKLTKRKKSLKKEGKEPPGRTQILAPLEYYPEEIKNIFLPHFPFIEACIGTTTKKVTLSKIDIINTKVGEIAIQLLTTNDYKIIDEDDLSHKILVNFPYWLKGRLCSRILEEIFASKNVEKNRSNINEEVVKVFEGKRETTEDIQKQIWDYLIENRLRISQTIVPFNYLLKNRRVSYINPLNPVDMISYLSQFQRSTSKSEIIKRLPPKYRQNHPSYKGFVCPVDSPESESVGITLHHSRAAFINEKSQLELRHEIVGSPDNELGYATSLVPFYHHNDGVRNMMGAKNLRQALPLARRSKPVLTTGGEDEVQKLVKPLIDTGICPDASDQEGNLALGKDLLVAYLPWNGMNFEDAIAVGSHVVEQGIFNVITEKTVRKEIKPGWIPMSYSSSTVLPFDGLKKSGTTLVSGSIIAALGLEGANDDKRVEIRYHGRSSATLKNISFQRSATWTSGVLEYTLEQKFPLNVGDKLMGRHGNKGVIGAIIAEDKMPRLPDDKSIPKKFRRKAIDILLNPHGVISRMNIGQLLETHIGWLIYCGVDIKDMLLPDYKGKERHIGRAFFQGIDHDKIQKLLAKHGLDKYGRVRLDLRDSSKTKSPVVVGFQYIVRLNHIPEQKIQARRGGRNFSYNCFTGEAVHGKSHGGGQRVGEMEVWALSAYEANKNIEEMLGIKSDVVLVNSLIEGNNVDNKSSFISRLKDILFALLINIIQSEDGVHFSFIKPEEILQKIGNGRRITNNELFKSKLSAAFICNKGGKNPCKFKFLDGKRVPVWPTERTASKNLTIRFEDLLEFVGYRRKGPIKEFNGEYIQELIRVDDEKADGSLIITFSNKGEQVKAVVSPQQNNYPERWPTILHETYLYGRFPERKGKNYLASEVIDMLTKENGRYNLGNLQITCPFHKTSTISGRQPFKEVPSFTNKGMYDPRIFGSKKFAGMENNPLWGIIELPVEIPFPVSAFLGRFKKKNVPNPVNIKYIPVLPLRYRLPIKRDNGYIEDPFTGKGYRRILETCRQYEKTEDSVKRKKLLKSLNYRVFKLFKMLTEKLKGKEGLFRNTGLGRRVDFSARMVITPDTNLKLDQVGVPTPVLVELLGDKLLNWAKDELDYGTIVNELIEAIGLVKEANDIENKQNLKAAFEILKDWSWGKGDKEDKVTNMFYSLLVKFLDLNKDLVVILNRQPSLHKYSMQAFYPVPLTSDYGNVIRLCPLVCKGFGADFDGDEMAIHLPFSEEAMKEAKKLLPSRNILSLATGKPLVHFDQDFVLGTFWLGHKESGMRDEFLNILKEECCKDMVPQDGMKKGLGEKLLEHLVIKHQERSTEIIWQWMNLAFKCCTRMGVSFSFYELRDLSSNTKLERDAIIKSMPAGEDGKIDVEGLNGCYQDIGRKCLENVVSKYNVNVAGKHFAAMALSGARGSKQIRQILVSRGFLSPGDITFEADNKRFIFNSSLIEGLDNEESFYAAMNSRSSICDKKLGTSDAGYLTRRLVFALWPFYITKSDCGSKEEKRTPLTCKIKRGFCAKCYGLLPDGGFPEIGFPAGLIAAQSIGERGTQLSMQSFHTGTRGVNLEDVKKGLEGFKFNQDKEEYEKTDWFSDLKGAHEFINSLKDINAYKDIEARHFQVLWKAIFDSNEKTLKCATTEIGPLSCMAFEAQLQTVFYAALNKVVDPLTEPVARILFNSLK